MDYYHCNSSNTSNYHHAKIEKKKKGESVSCFYTEMNKLFMLETEIITNRCFGRITNCQQIPLFGVLKVFNDKETVFGCRNRSFSSKIAGN